MEHLEIVLIDFPKDNIDELVFEELKINDFQIKSSHFFNNETMKEIQFNNVKSLKKIFTPCGTGNILLHQLDLGLNIKDVIIIFSFDEIVGDITFNFPEDGIEVSEILTDIKIVVQLLLDLRGKFNIPTIKFGFEPATDNDTCIIKLSDGECDLETIARKIIQGLK